MSKWDGLTVSLHKQTTGQQSQRNTDNDLWSRFFNTGQICENLDTLGFVVETIIVIKSKPLVREVLHVPSRESCHGFNSSCGVGSGEGVNILSGYYSPW